MIRSIIRRLFQVRFIRACHRSIEGGGDMMKEVQEGYRFTGNYAKPERPSV